MLIIWLNLISNFNIPEEKRKRVMKEIILNLHVHSTPKLASNFYGRYDRFISLCASLIEVYLAVLFVTSRTCLCMLGRCPFLFHVRHLSKIFHVATHILLTMYCLHLLPNAHILIFLTDPHLRWWIPCPPPPLFLRHLCRLGAPASLVTPCYGATLAAATHMLRCFRRRCRLAVPLQPCPHLRGGGGGAAAVATLAAQFPLLGFSRNR